MTYRSPWALGLVFASAVAGACSSKSNTPATDDGGDAGPPMEMEASICPAMSLAVPADAGLASCFACTASMCMAELTTCTTDCMCAPAYQCLEQNSNGGSINTGYSQCQAAVSALSNGDAALMNLQKCQTMMCNAPCFGGGGSTSGD